MSGLVRQCLFQIMQDMAQPWCSVGDLQPATSGDGTTSLPYIVCIYLNVQGEA